MIWRHSKPWRGPRDLPNTHPFGCGVFIACPSFPPHPLCSPEMLATPVPPAPLLRVTPRSCWETCLELEPMASSNPAWASLSLWAQPGTLAYRSPILCIHSCITAAPRQRDSTVGPQAARRGRGRGPRPPCQVHVGPQAAPGPLQLWAPHLNTGGATPSPWDSWEPNPSQGGSSHGPGRSRSASPRGLWLTAPPADSRIPLRSTAQGRC